MTELKRKNGYYLVKDIYHPSVTTVCKGGGGAAAGLMRWAAEQGGVRVLTELSKLKDSDRLADTLGNHDSIEWAKQQAAIGFANGGGWARTFGSEVHRLIEDLVKGREDTVALEHLPEEIVTAYRTYKEALSELDLNKSKSEEAVVFSDAELRYAGRCDLAAALNKESVNNLTPYLTKSSEPLTIGTYIVDFKTGELYPQEHKAQLAAYANAYAHQYKVKLAGGIILNVNKKDPTNLKVVVYGRETLQDAYLNGFKVAYKAWLYWEAPQWYQKQTM